MNTAEKEIVKCDVCDRKYEVNGCCIKIQCPCGNFIKTCSE